MDQQWQSPDTLLLAHVIFGQELDGTWFWDMRVRFSRNGETLAHRDKTGLASIHAARISAFDVWNNIVAERSAEIMRSREEGRQALRVQSTATNELRLYVWWDAGWRWRIDAWQTHGLSNTELASTEPLATRDQAWRTATQRFDSLLAVREGQRNVELQPLS